MKKFLYVIALVFCLGSCVLNDDSEDEVSKNLLDVGTEAPDFMIYTNDNPEGFLFSTLRGKCVVLEFWRSWCSDCQAAEPTVKALHTQYASNDTVFVGVSFDTDSTAWQGYIDEHELNWIQFTELKAMKESPVAALYGVKWTPTFYIIDAKGKIEYGTIEVDDLAKELASDD